ncbi:NAD(P)/FAD-dependent oxidoreductase [Streptomyces sp. NBC_00083]|uniref:flavin monoamine oxidase family protein n=1 Tax=Streptomyces sp. NBC_00083 TaxID=2975647 RepID=UPI00224DD34D|nr:NAD(P)/FAD-dependent oxidoreductase [Streptomyces sp. NBC_00083]MCX5386997.1 FAD-dependent oxidoreductase [Streptomyces sp. NBC_00083]
MTPPAEAPLLDPALPACDLQADFPFDYARYLASGAPMGRLPGHRAGARVAVIGCGGAGLTAAYELMRAGCRPVLYEAERDPAGPGGVRLGGRMYSVRLDRADSAVAELGCMRFPESARLLRHYAAEFGLRWRPSRDNYTPHTPSTVLEVDGRRYRARRLGDLYPQNPEMAAAHRGWLAALHRVGVDDLRRATAARDLGELRRLWARIVQRYETWSFYRFLRDEEGAGLSHGQAALLGTMGIGAAQWDSFFDLSMLEILRLVLTTEGSPLYYPQEGISALADGFWTRRTDTRAAGPRSLADLHHGRPRRAVTALEVPDDPARGVCVHDEDGRAEWYAAAVFTPQLHLLQTTVALRGADGGGSPFGPRLWRAVRRLSYWQSAKTALLTEEPFWQGTTMDGVTLTDRLPRAAYTVDYGPPHAPGGRRAVLELSYTWGQDAMKVAASPLEERLRLFLDDLGRIHPDVAGELRRQADRGRAVTISWENQRNFRGLSRFSRPGEYTYQRDLFSHFMKDFSGTAAVPGEAPNALFLAGDDTAWSAGWLDHALASGINAAWGVLRLLGADTDPDRPGPGDMWLSQYAAAP